jgi:hypothetical protein
MEAALKIYLKECQTIFKKHHSKLSKVIPLPGKKEPSKDDRQFFEAAIKEAEGTEEFAAFAKGLGAGPLAAYLENMTKKEMEKDKPRDIDKLKLDTECHAANAFFRNTGTYVNLWQGVDIDESRLKLDNYSHKSELIRLFVFDGFVPYHGKKMIDNVSLPVGEFRRYTEKELGDMLGLPYSSWHWTVNPEIIEKAAIWHILTVREKAQYTGIGGLWIGGRLAYSFDWFNVEATKKEKDVDLIGPIFLCIGEDANLATEIRIRTNIFESFPVYQKIRNDYLSWEPDGEDAEPKPRKNVKYIGEEGSKLRKIFEIWQRVNALGKDGHLRYPTEAYVRSVMNLHTYWESMMEPFVGFVTVIESLLTPDGQELAYKMAVRGASLLASDPEHRMRLFQILAEFYRTRSQIVHEGRTNKKDPYELNNMISHNLSEISRQIFLRYICLLYLGLEGNLPDWLLPDSKKLSFRNSRPKVIAHILDGLVLNPKLTERLEERMEELGVYEDLIRSMGLLLGLRRASG